MKRISRNKERIFKSLAKQGIDFDPDEDYSGYLIVEDLDGDLVITCPAPTGEPRHYNSYTDTGGRRFVCWAD